jgi:hypothetical protein
MEACDRLGAEYGGTPTGAMKLMMYAGMNTILGRDWTIERPPDHQLTRATQTKQSVTPDTLDKPDEATSISGRFSGINPSLPDEQHQHIWNVLKNEHLTPLDQMKENDRVAELSAQLLYHHAWERLTTEEQERVHEIITAIEKGDEK